MHGYERRAGQVNFVPGICSHGRAPQERSDCCSSVSFTRTRTRRQDGVDRVGMERGRIRVCPERGRGAHWVTPCRGEGG